MCRSLGISHLQRSCCSSFPLYYLVLWQDAIFRNQCNRHLCMVVTVTPPVAYLQKGWIGLQLNYKKLMYKNTELDWLCSWAISKPCMLGLLHLAHVSIPRLSVSPSLLSYPCISPSGTLHDLKTNCWKSLMMGLTVSFFWEQVLNSWWLKGENGQQEMCQFAIGHHRVCGMFMGIKCPPRLSASIWSLL